MQHKWAKGIIFEKKFCVHDLSNTVHFCSGGNLAQGNNANRRISAYAINMVSSLRPRHCLKKLG